MQPITKYLKNEMSQHGNAVKAPQMQAYMKTDQPFYGVQSKLRKQIFRDAIKKYPITSREEWETEQREWEAFHRKMEAEEKLKAMEAPSGPRALPDDAATEESTNIWKRCFMDTDCGDSETPLGVAMFGIGACLAELGLDLKETDEARPLVKTLNRDFGNLRETMNNSLYLFEPVVQRLSENLDTVVELRPDLADKCGDLQNQLQQLAERVAPRPA